MILPPERASSSASIRSTLFVDVKYCSLGVVQQYRSSDDCSLTMLTFNMLVGFSNADYFFLAYCYGIDFRRKNGGVSQRVVQLDRS